MPVVQAVSAPSDAWSGDNKSLREILDITAQELRCVRSPLEPHYRDLGFNFLPRSGRWANQAEQKAKDRQNKKLIDSVPRMAARTLGSGMMAGLTSPARPWFRLTTPDPERC